MIKNIEFINFRNLHGKKYDFSQSFNLILGKNGSGKTNLLEGIKLAFSSFDNSYVKVDTSDFTNSDDSKAIEINVLLEDNAIPSFNLHQSETGDICGFKVVITKTRRGQYRKRIYNYDGSTINSDIVFEDSSIPTTFLLPMRRIEDVYSDYASIGLDRFIESEEQYMDLKEDFSNSVKTRLEREINAFKRLCEKYGQDFDVEISGAKISGESVYVVNGTSPHNRSIGSGYRSIANIILNTIGGGYSIVLIDEIENHLHPSLLRTLIEELKSNDKIFIVATTHSPVAINQIKIEELIEIEKGSVSELVKKEIDNNEQSKDIIDKLNIFLHPGRNELMLADNVVVVEGFSEELILRHYVAKENINLTVVNAEGVMFTPYLTLAKVLSKRVVAISDDDRGQSADGNTPTSRFTNLAEFCIDKGITILKTDNTFETDIYNAGLCEDDTELTDMLKPHPTHTDILIARSNMKTKFAMRLVEKNIDLSEWHIVKGITDEFASD